MKIHSSAHTDTKHKTFKIYRNRFSCTCVLCSISAPIWQEWQHWGCYGGQLDANPPGQQQPVYGGQVPNCPTGCCVAQLPPLYKWSLPTIWCPTTALSNQRTCTFSTGAVWSQEPIIGQQFTLLKTSWTWCLDFYFDLGATASAGGMTPRHTRNCHLAASQAQRAKKVLNNAI